MSQLTLQQLERHIFGAATELTLVQRIPHAWVERMKLRSKIIDLRDLGFRWDSCSKNGSLNFHWATMLLPASVIDYVIVHELAHLKHRNHSPEFWKLVETTMPEFAERKACLAERGGDLAGL